MTQIIKDKYFSSTELKNNTKNILDTTQELWEVFIMNNNKPKAVIMSVEKYNDINKYYIPEIEADKWEKEYLDQYKKEKESWKVEFIEENTFFKNLKNV